jgi:hypothetical protein
MVIGGLGIGDWDRLNICFILIEKLGLKPRSSRTAFDTIGRCGRVINHFKNPLAA